MFQCSGVVVLVALIKVRYQLSIDSKRGNMVKYIKNMSEFNTLMETEDKLIVVDFTASW